jgi:hypothetical protein
MTEIKAIETIYKGYRFRSRLEARWAVFFDAVGVPFEYEKEGFDLGKGAWYLPDFWLPSLKLWVEIKSELTWVEHNVPDCSAFASSQIDKLYSCPELDLMRRFRDCQSWPVACIVGQPGEHRIWFFAWDMSDSSAGNYEDDDAFWCISKGQVALNVHIVSPHRNIYADTLYGPILEHFIYARDYGYVLEPIENALTHARQARFEYGEKPQVR